MLMLKKAPPEWGKRMLKTCNGGGIKRSLTCRRHRLR